jgi:alkanesulfonate monooxygenase SsuD/methylene tetrahydromethanopterin reductase-like flavin-dependent oxidoreductase (luciferase family)
VYPIPTRTPFQIAMATATLNEVSNKRVGFIGLGVGYRARIEQYFGLKIKDSLSKMKEYVEIIQGLLSGNDFSYSGKYFDFQDFPKLVSEPSNISILLGASGDKMLKLAGKIADGVILNSIGTEQYFKYAISVLSNSARETNRDTKSFEIASSVILSVADKHENAIDAARHDVLFYVLYPELDPVIEKTPYVQKVAEIRKANSKGESREALSLISDDIVEDLSISGTRKECRNKIRKLYDYGITLPIIRVSVKPFKENERKEVFLRAIEVSKN